MNPGLYAGVPMADYLALPYLSAGLCNTLLQYSPFHAHHEQEHREADDTEASDTGTAIHDALLEGMDRIQPIDALDWRTKAAKELRDMARSEGKIPMLAIKVERVRASVEAARNFLARKDCEIRDFLAEGQPEVVGVWDEGGTLCKLRADWLSDRWHISVKTTEGSANPGPWIRRQLTPMGYDNALAFYERGLRALARDVEHRFLIVEQLPPHGCAVVGLAPSKREIAEGSIERAIKTWQACAKSGRWPSYPAATHFAEAATWEMAEHEERMLSDPFNKEELSGGIPA